MAQAISGSNLKHKDSIPMETDNFFQESQAQIPKMLIWAGRFYRFQKPLFGNFYGDLPDQWS